jgi:drug/metabolite transporter (DMT)-like permease
MNSRDSHPAANTRAHHILAAGSLAAAGSLWGTGFLFGKIAMVEMTVAENVAFRLLTGALVLLPVALRHWKPFRGRELWILLLASVIGIPVQFLIQFYGLALTTVSHASLIVGVLPVMLAAASAVILHERIHGLEYGALALSASGAILIALSSRETGNGPRASVHGDALVLLSMCAAVAMILCSKRLIVSHGALPVTATSVILGTMLLLAWVELTEPVRFHFSGRAWGAVIAQGVLATAAAYLFWNWGLAHMPASKAGVFLNLEPVVGAILGVTILRERLGQMAILGGIFIIGAAVYFSLRPQPA